MLVMRLDAAVKQKIAKELGRPVPPPSDESFWSFVEEVRAARPELAAELEEGIIFDDLGDPEREAQRADARAVARRMFFRRLFYRFDEVRQRWHLHRGKLMGWGVLLFLAFFLPTFYWRPTPPVMEAASLQTDAASMSGGAVAEAQTSEPRRPPEPLVVEQPEEPDPMTRSTPLVVEDTMPLNPQPQVPTSEEPSSLRAYSKEAAEVESRGLNAYSRSGGAAGAPQAGSSDPFADPSSTVQTAGLSAYREPQPEAQTEPRGLSAYSKEAAPFHLRTLDDDSARTLDDDSAERGAEQSAEATDPLPEDSSWQEPQGDAGGQEPQYAQVSDLGMLATDPFSTPSTRGEVPNTGAATGTEAPADGELYRAGDTVDGELAVGLIALGGDAMPVIVRGRDGSVWQGQAALNASGRVDITFSSAAGERGSQSLEAIALAEDGYAGVPATIRETTPALASDLARGALRGAGEFVEGLRDQSSVTLSHGAALLSRDAPPLDASVLGSVARLFSPPEGEDQQALVRLAEVPAGTKLQIMVLGVAAAENAQTP